MEKVSLEGAETIKKPMRYTIEGIEARPMVLRDFDEFLRSEQAYREGEYSIIPLSEQEGFRLSFFNDEPNPDDVFEIKMNFDSNIVEVLQKSGNVSRFTPYLNKFGFSVFE